MPFYLPSLKNSSFLTTSPQLIFQINKGRNNAGPRVKMALEMLAYFKTLCIKDTRKTNSDPEKYIKGSQFFYTVSPYDP